MEKDNWEIVYTAAGNYIGRRVSQNDSTIKTLDPAFIWINEQVMVGPGQMAMMRQPIPLQGTLEASTIDITQHCGVQELDEWPEYARDEVLRQVENIIDNMKLESAKRAGIEIPGHSPEIGRKLLQDILRK